MKSIITSLLMLIQMTASGQQVSINSNLESRESGGGNVLASYFPIYSRYGLELLSNVFNEISLEDIQRVISETEIYTVKNLCFKDPSNYGQLLCRDAEYDKNLNRIRFDMSKWTSLSCKQKMTIASHEYLRALKLEKADYKYSSLISSGEFYRTIGCGVTLSDDECHRRQSLNLDLDHQITYICDRLWIMEGGRNE